MHARAIVVAIALTAGCGPASQPAPPPPPPEPLSIAQLGLDESAMSLTTDPCVDFHQFACGGWVGKAAGELAPQSRASELSRDVDNQLRVLLEGLASRPDLPADLARARDFYAACMDESKIVVLGLEPLQAMLVKIAAIRNRRDMAAVVGELHDVGVWPFFTLSPVTMATEPGIVLALISGETTGNASNDAIANALVAAGYTADAAARAAIEVAGVKERLGAAGERAAAAPTRVERAGLGGLAPRFSWKSYFTARSRPELDGIAVDSPELVVAIGKETSETPLAAHRHYLAWSFVSALAPLVSDQSAVASESGAAPPPPGERWKRCVTETNRALGHAVGRAFVAENELGASVPEARELITALGGELSGHLERLEPGSGAAARARSMAILVGTPAVWDAYEVEIDPGVYLGNVLQARRWSEQTRLLLIGEAPDRRRWPINPQAPAAHYSADHNQLVVPAALLRRPFFSPSASPAVRLGALSAALGDQLAMALGGEREPRCPTRVEVSDVETLRAGYRLLQKRLRARSTPRPPSRLTDEQAFFVAAAQASCERGADSTRNATFAETPELADAFSCPAAAAMNPAARCAAW